MVNTNLPDVVEQLRNAATAGASFIAGPTPANPIEAAAQSTARKSCELLSAAPGAITLFSQQLSGLAIMCEPYLTGQGYSLPNGTLITTISWDAQVIGAPGCGNPITIPLTLDWPGDHTGAIFDEFDNGPAVCIGQGGIGNNPIFIDGNGNTISDTRNITYVAPPFNVVATVSQGLIPGVNPAPNPGPGFEPVNAPVGELLPLLPLPTVYDDPIFGPNTPFPTLPPEDGVYQPIPTPDVAPLPPSGDSTSDDPPNPGLDDGLIVGVVVSVTQDPVGRITEIDQSPGPILVIPRLGTVFFSMRMGCDASWSEGIEVKHRRVFIPTPGNMPAVSATFVPFNGSAATLTPIRESTLDEEGVNSIACA